MNAPLTAGVLAPSLQAARLERVFAQCFFAAYRTRLQGGATEPLYQPPGPGCDIAVIHYRGDYFASALHEVAHWCIAGAQRRQQVDFGYWYAPDGRDAARQRAFERVECKPQALEWFFSRACGARFRVSVDNLATDGELPDTRPFQRALLQQVGDWQAYGLPRRAAQFFDALAAEFGTEAVPSRLDFGLQELR